MSDDSPKSPTVIAAGGPGLGVLASELEAKLAEATRNSEVQAEALATSEAALLDLTEKVKARGEALAAAETELAASRALHVYVRDWVRGRNPRKVVSFDREKLAAITEEANKITKRAVY